MIEWMDNNGKTHHRAELKPCPFCGAEPTVTCIGNWATKSRKVRIECPGCHITRTVATLTQGNKWCMDVIVSHWNTRAAEGEK